MPREAMCTAGSRTIRVRLTKSVGDYMMSVQAPNDGYGATGLGVVTLKIESA